MEAVKKSGWKRDIERDCPICEKRYLASQKRLELGKQTTCSRACSYTLRGRQKQARVDGVCAVCRKDFSRPASHVKGKYGANFCSRPCHYTGRRLGLSQRNVTKPYEYTEGGRTRLSKAAARLYASGKSLAFPKTELAVVEALTNLRVPFVHQHLVELEDRAFVVDFIFPGRALAIELDRARLHNRRTTHDDTERDKILAGLGFRVTRLRDNGRPDHVVRAVMATLLQGT